MFTITLADGSVIENLGVNGNNFISDTELTEDLFKDNMSHVEIKDNDTGEVYTMEDAELVQIAKYGEEYHFILRELTGEEKIVHDLQESVSHSADDITDIQIAMAELYEVAIGDDKEVNVG